MPIDAFSVLCAQLTRDLLEIAKFLFLSAIRDNFSATSQRLIFAKFGHDMWIVGEKQNSDINLWKVSIQGSFAPKTQNSEQATGQGIHCREILLIPRCSPRARKFPTSGQLFCTTYGCGATGLQSCPIFGFWPILPIQKPVKRTCRWPAYSPGVTSQNDSGYSMW